MTHRAITSQNYSRLKKSIASELMAGAERVRRSYREEVVRTAWNIGKILRGTLGLEDVRCPANASLIARLSKDFDRPESFFYDTAKFHRLYPDTPPVALSWTHYSALIRLENPRDRRALEKMAITEGLSAKDLRLHTLLRPGLKLETGSPKGYDRFVLPVERGHLYHYRAANAPVDGRVLIDIGFGIDRDVRCRSRKSFHSGLIVRAERKIHAFNLNSLKGRRDGPIPKQGGIKSGAEDYSAVIAPFEKSRLYTYAASLKRVIDGDTLIARVDLGFRTWKTETFRLRGIDAPELTCALGRKAKAFVVEKLNPCACLVIKTYKQEKFGRFLTDVFYLAKAGDDRERILKEGTFLNQELLDEGLALPYDGD